MLDLSELSAWEIHFKSWIRVEGLRAANANIMGIVQKQVADLNARYGREVIHIVPVGNAVIRLRELVVDGKIPGINKQSELFSDPIGHASLSPHLVGKVY